MTDDHRFGRCPACGLDDGFLDCERGHWFICKRHHVRWFAGSNLFRLCRSLRHDDPACRVFFVSFLPVDGFEDETAPPPVPASVAAALERVLDYHWEAEQKDFEAEPVAADGHIFNALCLVRWWLSGLPWENAVNREGGDGA